MAAAATNVIFKLPENAFHVCTASRASRRKVVDELVSETARPGHTCGIYKQGVEEVQFEGTITECLNEMRARAELDTFAKFVPLESTQQWGDRFEDHKDILEGILQSHGAFPGLNRTEIVMFPAGFLSGLLVDLPFRLGRSYCVLDGKVIQLTAAARTSQRIRAGAIEPARTRCTGILNLVNMCAGGRDYFEQATLRNSR